jgi:hypothetical protein
MKADWLETRRNAITKHGKIVENKGLNYEINQSLK